ncbi:MAG: hypothetical protein DWQ04_29060 [Chloroflexi bacterium]|nr:MAG: hypothetical protein DWQ04_29060 [Chloroflexota bacterium]
MKAIINSKKTIQTILLIGFIIFAAACGNNATTDTTGNTNASRPDPVFENRVPNNGAAVKIVSPTTGATVQKGTQVILEIETTNFDMSDEGKHWHVYVDGQSWGMVTGGNMDQPLTGLGSGEHEIGVYLSIETHEELEEGDSITIVVSE